MATKSPPRKPDGPPMDEWGVYDPQQAGLAALFARLDSKAEAPKPDDVPLVVVPRRPALRDAK